MKVLCVVQARMGSERLPEKVIKPILGKPMILFTLNRLKKSRYIDELILATSMSAKEEPLVQIVEQDEVKVYRGEENNVLKRYVDAYSEFGGDIIVRVTGDCPFIDPQVVDNAISYFMMYDYDFVRLDVPDTFVRGFDVEVFSAKALLKTYEQVYSISDDKEKNSYTEHVTLYMYRHQDMFKVAYLKGENLYNKNYRLCVDTIEDFELAKDIFEHFKDMHVSSVEVVKYMDSHPELAEINRGITQKKA